MRFYVARHGAVIGEFEEQTFRNKVFAGEIMPTDFYWRAGLEDYHPVSDFRVARKTEVILIDPQRLHPPALDDSRADLRVRGVVAGILVLTLFVVLFVIIGR